MTLAMCKTSGTVLEDLSCLFFHDRGYKIEHVPIETKSCILYVMCSSIPLCS